MYGQHLDCPACGYDLYGADGVRVRCPECGNVWTRIDIACLNARRRIRGGDGIPRTLAIVIGAAGIAWFVPALSNPRAMNPAVFLVALCTPLLLAAAFAWRHPRQPYAFCWGLGVPALIAGFGRVVAPLWLSQQLLLASLGMFVVCLACVAAATVASFFRERFDGGPAVDD